MADFDNLAEINENFDTIKTLLNSIRAQGILNTSDVDKLLSGINMKLEKINTEEDIDLIKIFLSELKQNLDERHTLLISKFGAIESLFANLLKNSSEMLKSSEVKELFDIVATNLSVFSREVVSQKESLTDISLRLDAIRSDDSQKKDIIKNITILKSDIERLNNGFDSIVISLNDNFKTVVKTIASLDKVEYFEKFSDVLSNIEMSSNTVLSALQMLDKKAEQVELALKDVASKDDMAGAAQKIFELTAQSQELTAEVSDLNKKYIKFETLSEKIDASVNIIASLKSVLEDTDNANTHKILAELSLLQENLLKVSSEEKFEELKNELGTVFKFIQERLESLGSRSVLVFEEVQKLAAFLQALDIQQSLQELKKELGEVSTDLVAEIQKGSQTVITLNESGVTRVISEISNNADSLSAKLAQAQSEIGIICEKNFNSVFQKVADVKALLAQIDENNVSANNAIFSSITDRLSIFETGLRDSLEIQEKTVLNSSAQLVEQIENIKNISNVLDYKLDASVVESANVKQEFAELKTSVENVLALDFTNVVKDLRIDLYAVKQELSNTFENSSSDLSEKFTSDLYGKYELLISKIDSVEEELRKTQISSLASLKGVLDNISSSLVDVISYVSERKTSNSEADTVKFDEIINLINDNNISYVENVRDIVDVIRVQVDNNIKSIEEENLKNFDNLKRVVSENSEDLKKEIKYSYSKLLELQDSYNEIQELLTLSNQTDVNKFTEVLASTDSLRKDVELKLESLKNTFVSNISDFKTEFTCENADKISEIKFSVESLYAKSAKDIKDLMSETKEAISKLSADEISGRTLAIAKINDNFSALKELLYKVQDKQAEVLDDKINVLLQDLAATREVVASLDENVDGDMNRQLSIIESNFESLVSQITILFDKSELSLANKVESEFAEISKQMQTTVENKLDTYKKTIEDVFEELKGKSLEQSDYLQQRISSLHETLKEVWDDQSKDISSQLLSLTDNLKTSLDNNIELSRTDLNDLKSYLESFLTVVETKNNELSNALNVQIDDIAKFVNIALETQAQDNEDRQSELNTLMQDVSNEVKNAKDAINGSNFELSEKIADLKGKFEQINAEIKNNKEEISRLNSELVKNINVELKNNNDSLLKVNLDLEEKFTDLKSMAVDSAKEVLLVTDAYVNNIIQQLEVQKNNITSCKDLIINAVKAELAIISTNIEKETDIVIGEIIEQFDLLKKSQADDVVNITARMEEIISANIYSNIEDLKSYLDIKTDDTVLNAKFDNLKVEMVSGIDSVLDGMSKLLDSGAFVSSMTDFKLANEVLVNSAVDTLNTRFEEFLNVNFSDLSTLVKNNTKTFEERLVLFDKKFVEILVDKFEEIKLTASSYNASFDKIQESFGTILSEFDFVKQNINNEINSLSQIVKSSATATNTALAKLNDSVVELSGEFTGINDKISEINQDLSGLNNDFAELNQGLTGINDNFDKLNQNYNVLNNGFAELNQNYTGLNNCFADLGQCFEELREQISDKDADEAFKTSLNNQVQDIENLVNEELSYLESIEDLCASNLPDVAEISTLMKHSVVNKLAELSDKIDGIEITVQIDNELKQLKSEIITQILNVFNQISFVVEQEEIIDFIQDKHDELITILSHIVTTSDVVEEVKDNVVVIDNKVDSLKEDIDLINEKITAIISADGDIDYVYSLHDLEADIANLRLALNEMKESNGNFDELISSTNDIYNLVETIKTELPTKQDYEGMAEDIVSISTRTNKLILASDESYKNLQDNLQDFKLVINDLDERTRNFAQEAGLDRIDVKLNALNNMVQNGAKTNQVFNQVFEYLAEWVDKASNQINSISDKVETLDDIGQIKAMLMDIKEGSEDNTETVELIEALGDVFDKQTKRISALETKLDKIIVETTINNKNNKLDLTPFESTLNSFLVAIDERMSKQQEKIDSLEAKLENIINSFGDKDTQQLTKKVGGMDRQIAKLNKSIEKIASYVVEK